MSLKNNLRVSFKKSLLSKLKKKNEKEGLEGIEPTSPLLTVWYSTIKLQPISLV